jgi:hypothetical protein
MRGHLLTPRITALGVVCLVIVYILESFEATRSPIDILGRPTRTMLIVDRKIFDTEFHEI